MLFITYDHVKNQKNLDDRGLDFDRASELDWYNAWNYEDEQEAPD